MRTSKFYLLFSTLNKDEIKEFDKFFKKNYPSRKKELSLFRYVQKHHLQKDAAHRLDKETVAKKYLKINPVTTVARKRISNDLSQLTQYLEDFLLWQKIKDQPLSRDLMLLDIYKERQLDDFFFTKIDKVKKQLQEHPTDTPFYHLNLMRLHHDTFFHTNFPKIAIGAEPLEKSMEHLDSFFSLTKIKLAMEMLNRQNVLQEDYDIYFLEEAINYLATVKKSSSIFIPLVGFLQSPTEKGFVDLKKRLFKDFKKLPNDERLIVITYLLNYTSTQMKQGKILAYQKAFELFKFGLENKIFIGEDGYISPIKFTNIALVGSRSKEFDWVNTFIKKWSPFLEQQKRTNSMLLAKLYVALESEQIEEAYTISRDIQLGENFTSLRIRGIILRIYFDLYGDSKKDLIKDYCNAFSIYLTRNKTFSSKTKKSYKSLINFVRLMLQGNLTKQELYKKLQKTEFNFYKPWIESKIQEFKN